MKLTIFALLLVLTYVSYDYDHYRLSVYRTESYSPSNSYSPRYQYYYTTTYYPKYARYYEPSNYAYGKPYYKIQKEVSYVKKPVVSVKYVKKPVKFWHN